MRNAYKRLCMIGSVARNQEKDFKPDFTQIQSWLESGNCFASCKYNLETSPKNRFL